MGKWCEFCGITLDLSNMRSTEVFINNHYENLSVCTKCGSLIDFFEDNSQDPESEVYKKALDKVTLLINRGRGSSEGIKYLNRLAGASQSDNYAEPVEKNDWDDIRGDVVVTTGDLHQKYDIICPVFYQISNKGLVDSDFDKMKKRYSSEISAMKSKGAISEGGFDFGFLYGEWSVGQNDFETAFFIATEEIKKRAKKS